MHVDQAPYRDLHDRILNYDGSAMAADLLHPWARSHATAERDWLAAFDARAEGPPTPATPEDLWRLYALSRIADLLITPLGPPAVTADTWSLPEVAAADVEVFMRALGLQPIPDRTFSPLFHEIVEVEPADDSATPPSVRRQWWPGWTLGPMILIRSGVTVRSGSDHIEKSVAETSCLYWTYARRHRRTQDLSVGWGSNSQWRTAFRRDYLFDGFAHYNVDGKAPSELMDGLTAPERDELVRHRCFVRCNKPDGDLWPYEAALVEPA